MYIHIFLLHWKIYVNVYFDRTLKRLVKKQLLHMQATPDGGL